MKDIWNTMLWPTVILLARYTSLFERRAQIRPAPPQPD
jgi:hypothetical protein